MARMLVLAAAAPLLLIGAAYPGDKPGAIYGDDDDYVAEAPVTYRPCRPGPGDDHCIQLYERGVRASYARWLRSHDVGEEPRQVAMGGPLEPAAHHPRRRHHARNEERCRDHGEADGEARGM